MANEKPNWNDLHKLYVMAQYVAHLPTPKQFSIDDPADWADKHTEMGQAIGAPSHDVDDLFKKFPSTFMKIAQILRKLSEYLHRPPTPSEFWVAYHIGENEALLRELAFIINEITRNTTREFSKEELYVAWQTWDKYKRLSSEEEGR